MKKKCYLGETTEGFATVTLELQEDELRISGEIGYNYMGQIASRLKSVHFTLYSKDWNEAAIQELCSIWDRWHLNTMRAGTPNQEHVIRQITKVLDREDWYTSACSVLEQLDLYEDKEGDNYKYGSKWLKEELPEEVVAYIKALPKGTAPTK